MNVLILGAGGFLGRHVRAHLEAQADSGQDGFEVLSAPPSRDLDLACAGPEAWDELLDGAAPGAVVNCAGRTSGSPEELRAGNVMLVRGLIGAALRRPAPPRLIHLGSAAEYGPQAGVVSEATPARPDAPYGQSKLAGTQALLEARARLPLTVLRVCNPVGAGQGAQTLTGRAALVFRQALEDGQAEVPFGNLSAARDFIDARDVARAVGAVLRHPPPEALLNVGRGEAVTARTLVTALARISGYRGRVSEQADGSGRSAGLAWQQADVTRLRRHGWTPAYTLDDALEALWQGSHAPPPSPVRELTARGAP